jgi:hypothetical protein
MLSDQQLMPGRVVHARVVVIAASNKFDACSRRQTSVLVCGMFTPDRPSGG